MKLFLLKIVVFISLADLSLSQSSCIDCTLEDNGLKYNFLPMSSPSGYSFKDSSSNNKYYLNICCPCVQCANISPLSGSCIQPPAGTAPTANIGSTPGSSLRPLNSGIQGASITYGGGGACSGGIFRSISIMMMCAPNEETTLLSVIEISKCTYVAKVTSKYACALNTTTTTTTTSLSSTTTSSSGTISGGTISGGTISGGTISGGTISGGTISGGTISGGTISGGTISSATISSGTISGGTTITSNNTTTSGNRKN